MNNPVKQLVIEQRAALAESAVARQYELQADIWQPFGPTGRAKSVRDTVWHFSYLAEAIGVSDPTLFVDYVVWARELFAGLKFADDMLPTTLRCMQEAAQTCLDPAAQTVVNEYIQAALERLAQPPPASPSFIQPDAPLAGLAARYLDALLRGERQTASRMILEAVDAGASVRDIYLHVFQPAQREVGRLWQTNRISVAQEHYCTAATQLIMSQLYPRIFSAEKIGRRLVATCVSGELHELGARMVADLFELAGWDTYYIGANTPTESIVRTAVERRPDVAAISATITFNIGQVGELIHNLRAQADGIKILVGGYPFNASPNLWQRVGADGYAPDAEQAIALAQRLVGAR